LITLGIIGIVAALTMPALIASYRKHVVETRLQKFYSVMNQAVKLAEVEDGDGWAKNCFTTTCTTQEASDWFNEYMGKHINSVLCASILCLNPLRPTMLTRFPSGINKFAIKTEISGNNFFVYFADGSILRIQNNLIDTFYFIDQKALLAPNIGVNTFVFTMNIGNVAYNNAASNNFSDMKDKAFEPYCFALFGIESRLSDPARTYSCTPGQNRYYCTRLIQNNGWKIPDNYPLKF
jgi:type II secretory pathway pseudopilin PulG